MKNGVKIYLPIFLLALFFARYPVGRAAQPSGGSPPGVGPQGEGKQTVSALDAKGAEAEKNGKWEDALYAYLQASTASRAGGQFEKAIASANKAWEMGPKARAPGLQGWAALALANAYGTLGQQLKAREWLEKGIEVIKQEPPGAAKEGIEANLYVGLGVNYLIQGEARKAVEYISYSLQGQESRLAYLIKYRSRTPPRAIPNSQSQLVSTFHRLGLAHDRAGNIEEAIKAYERGIAFIKQTGFVTEGEGSLYHGLGHLYLERKEFPRALENLQKALEVAEKRQYASVIQQAGSELGDLFRQTGKFAEAISHYRKAIESVESTRSLLESEEFRSSFFDDKRQTYAGMILAHLQGNNAEEAFNYNERARSRAFLDILGSKVQLGRSGSLIEEERALQARIGALQARTAAQEPDAADAAELRQELAAGQKAYNDFLVKVRRENKEQASLMNVEPLTLKQVRELLEPEVTLLEYFVVGQTVLLWVVDKDGLSVVNIPISRGDLVSKVSALRDSVFQIGENEKFRASSQELYKLLIEPALPHVRGKELLIIPHDVLHYVPFQALLSAQDKYLIQDYPIYYLSSASLMQFTHEKKRAGGEKALVMGNPSLGDAAYNLRFAEREAKEVAGVYPKSEVYLREQASKPRAISLSPGFEMLHFAVHAELSEEDPLSSALLLAGEGKDDGRLKVGEIFSLNLKAGMVVLSACETGLGKLSNGDEMVGLTRAFIYAGTPSIVTTLWKVNDRASYELMREFYQHLKSSKKSEALRQAQLTTMKEFPEPFYWAAYQLTGEP